MVEVPGFEPGTVLRPARETPGLVETGADFSSGMS